MCARGARFGGPLHYGAILSEKTGGIQFSGEFETISGVQMAVSRWNVSEVRLYRRIALDSVPKSCNFP